MTREIEYRVYDKKHKTIGRVIGWSRYGFLEEKGNIVYYVGDKSCLQPIDSDRIIVMQYTGIKDKNGVKIFGGDVIVAQTVERSPLSPDHVSGYLKGAIVYYDNSFCLLDDGAYNPYWTNAAEFEVIGNIHEDKE